MPEYIARLGWDAGRLAACRRDRLRALLARAIAGSPFHAGGSAASTRTGFELADLARLPPTRRSCSATTWSWCRAATPGGAASVHPFVIGAPLLRAPAVREFQLRQTEHVPVPARI
jgi:hypothetical protein